MSWLGLDIGVANLKAADGRGWAACAPFELWRHPNELQSAIATLIAEAPSAERVAVTMTGELCDCFRTKDEGVRHILAAVEGAVGRRSVEVYLVDGRFVSIAVARGMTQLAAASNWHALARFACRYVNGQAGMLIDVGSTTSDIIPLVDGWPHPVGCTDTDRLMSGELVYSGIGRTPVCAVAQTLPWRGATCPVAAEFFATTADAYLLLGELPEESDSVSPADGRPMTKRFARERLARMICADAALFSESDARAAAEAIRDAQLCTLLRSLARVVNSMPADPDSYLVSGGGEFVAKMVIKKAAPSHRILSVTETLGAVASRAAPAHALAVLAQEANA
jgi:probable H4MPT-linked C1 transfer pathway protein